MTEPLQATSLDTTSFRLPDHLRSADGSNGTVLEVLLINGEPWFYGIDVCRLIGLQDPKRSLSGLPERYRRIIKSSRGTQEPSSWAVLSEPGLYRLLMRSKLPAAEGFQSWIAEEVLPQIRRTGSYTLPSTPEALRALARTIEERDAALDRAQAAEQLALESTQRAAVVAPPAAAWMDISAVNGSWPLAKGGVTRILNRDRSAGRINRLRDLGEKGDRVSIGIIRASMYRLGLVDWDPNTKIFRPRRSAEVAGMIIIEDPMDLNTCNITPAGVARIHADLGGSDPLRVSVKEDLADSEVLVGEIM